MDTEILTTRKVLGLDPHTHEFRVIYGSFSASDKEIAIQEIISSLMLVFTLTETEGKEGASIVTIPVGG